MTRQGDRIKEVVSCQILIDEVIKLAESEANLREITIHAFVSNKVTDLFVDRVQIQQVILNLLRNGMEAMHAIRYKKGTMITIKAILNTASCVEIAIEDRGCGLSEKIIKKLFTPFLTTKKNGTGIGLSISKRIIEEHGGYIYFANNKSAGATFFFTLPVHNLRDQNEELNANPNKTANGN
jgi:two-component system sensor kinase FixL